ncbi:MAG: hypothetical protein ACFFEF_07935 [Candidatus Thorarchaeota archaeon]
MTEIERNTTLRNVLLKAAQEKTRVRLIGPPNTILSEGFVDFIGNGIVGMKHRISEEPDEFIVISSIIKIQMIGESHQAF